MEMDEVLIRQYDEVRDRDGVDSFERNCEVGPGGKTSLLTDSMGDPMCRIRHSPSSVMLVCLLDPALVHVCLPFFCLFFLKLSAFTDSRSERKRGRDSGGSKGVRSYGYLWEKDPTKRLEWMRRE